MNKSTKITPAMNSTSGYCQEILLLHFLQAPFRKAKLNIGTNSFQVRLVPHDRHFERPLSVMPVLKRNATTLRKLPTIAPKTNERIKENGAMAILIRGSNNMDQRCQYKPHYRKPGQHHLSKSNYHFRAVRAIYNH